MVWAKDVAGEDSGRSSGDRSGWTGEIFRRQKQQVSSSCPLSRLEYELVDSAEAGPDQ